jgi:DNA-binding transcriptional LysR family regulator
LPHLFAINVQHAMIKAGLGIAVLPHFIGKTGSSLVAILPDVVKIRRAFWIVVHQDMNKIARARAVIDGLVETAKADRTLT